jgi:hypothetical protein
MADLVTAIGSPILQTLYPFLAVLLLIAGLVLTASFFIYEATSTKFSRKLSQEFATGGISSLFLVQMNKHCWVWMKAYHQASVF